MLIGIVGTKQAGKQELAQYLVERHNFREIQIANPDYVTDEASTILHFASISATLDHLMVSSRWTKHYVIQLNGHLETLEELKKRPFFLLVSIQAPITLRFNRYRKASLSPESIVSFEEFARLDDKSLFFKKPNLDVIMHHADLKVVNTFKDFDKFYTYLDGLDIVNEERCRPSWDTYFIKLCDWSARRSNCMILPPCFQLIG